MKTVSRRALLIIGTHRSGTSALARVFGLLGADLPKNLLGASDSNVVGHWEPSELVALHDRLLGEAGSSWHDWQPIDRTRLSDNTWASYEEAIMNLLIDEYGDSELLVIKDPRLSKLVWVYDEILHDLGIEPAYFLPLRNPLSVRDSLTKRSGMSEEYAHAMWLSHSLEAEASTRHKTRLITGFGDLLEDWRSVASSAADLCGITWPLDCEAVSDQVDGFLSKSLRHHTHVAKDLAGGSYLDDLIRDAYNALRSLKEAATREQSYAELDRITREFATDATDVASEVAIEIDTLRERLYNDRVAMDEALSATDAYWPERLRTQINQLLGEKQRQAERDHRTVAGLEADAALYQKDISEARALISDLEAEREIEERVLRELQSENTALAHQADALLSRNTVLIEEASSLRSITETQDAHETAHRLQEEISDMRQKLSVKASPILEHRLLTDIGALPHKVARRYLRKSKGGSWHVRARELPGLSDLSHDVLDALLEAFDSEFYLREYPDVAAAGVNPFEHYMVHGCGEGREPSPDFSTTRYLQDTPSLLESGENPFVHWLLQQRSKTHGAPVVDDITAVVASSELMDPEWYLQNNVDVAAAGVPPTQHYAKWGAKEGRDPGPNFSTNNYLLANPDVEKSGVNPLWHWETVGREAGNPMQVAPSAQELIDQRFPQNNALNPVLLPKDRSQPRLTIITDSLGDRSLFGGVGTSLILGALLAERTGASLRLCTTQEPSDGSAFRNVLLQHGIKGPEQLECVTPSNDDVLDWGDNDVALTTSWWSTWAALRSVPANRVVYLLQEDERCFYPDGDEKIRCERLLQTTGPRVLVNTNRLYSHLCHSFPHLETDGVAFEPAFPPTLYQRSDTRNKKLHLVYYARPSHARNLFWLGLEALDRAALEGTLDPSAWDVTFLGSDIPRVKLANNIEPRRIERLPWQDYAALVRTADLGLSLMASPHPSYPPLDLAASGAVVVTNTWEGKNSLDDVCANILTAAPTPTALAEALRAGTTLAQDHGKRKENYDTAQLSRSWEDSLGAAVDFAAKAWPT